MAALATPAVNVLTAATILPFLGPLAATGLTTATAATLTALGARFFRQTPNVYEPVATAEPEPEGHKIIRNRKELFEVALTLLSKYSLNRTSPKLIPLDDLLSNLRTLRSLHQTYKLNKTIWEQAHKDFFRQGAIVVGEDNFVFKEGDDRVDAILKLLKFTCGGDETMAKNLALFCTQGMMQPILLASQKENKLVQGQASSNSTFFVTPRENSIEVRHIIALSICHLDDIAYQYGPGVPVWGSITYSIPKEELRSGQIENVTQAINYLIRTSMYIKDTEPSISEKPSYEQTAADFDADLKKGFNL